MCGWRLQGRCFKGEGKKGNKSNCAGLPTTNCRTLPNRGVTQDILLTFTLPQFDWIPRVWFRLTSQSSPVTEVDF